MNYRMFNADQELEQALKQLDFFVDIDLFLTDTAKLADIVLPCCSSFERSEFKVFGGGYGQWNQQPPQNPNGGDQGWNQQPPQNPFGGDEGWNQ